MEEKASSPLIPPPSEIDLEAGGGGDQLQCRICLETDGRDFIAPCKCKGTSKYVHRDCLDHWRAVKVALDPESNDVAVDCEKTLHMYPFLSDLKKMNYFGWLLKRS